MLISVATKPNTFAPGILETPSNYARFQKESGPPLWRSEKTAEGLQAPVSHSAKKKVHPEKPNSPRTEIAGTGTNTI